jgi:hypothetical protein
MDRVMLKQHLAQAEERIVKDERHLTRQRELVARLEQHGQGSGQARHLLLQFEQLQALHIADRDRLLKELGQPGQD